MAKKTTKKTKRPQEKGGPYIASAVFCDSVVKGEDGTMSVIRIIDHMTLTVPANFPPDIPSKKTQILGEISGLIGFKTGYCKQVKHNLKLVANSPDGNMHVIYEKDVDFTEPAHGGFSMRISMGIPVSETGLYWLDVILDGVTMTRMPLSVTVARASATDTKKADSKITRKSRTKKRASTRS